MPDRSDRLLDTADAAGEYELPYVSKSRVMQWIKNPEHYRLKYLEDIREPETDAMVRGSRIHETFEEFYGDGGIGKYAGNIDAGVEALPADRQLWADFVEPYVTNFLTWEIERWNATGGNQSDYLPVAIEDEHWRDPLLGIEDEPEWMGMADVILNASSVPSVDTDEGVVIVDFKTGSVPDEQYRGDGIYTELEYYVMLFEDEYNVTASGAYYPRANEFLVHKPTEQQRELIIESVGELVRHSADYDGDAKFEAKEGPLCGWSPEEGDRSPYYGICSQCTWNKPVDNQNTFEQMIEEDYSNREIAEELGCTTNAVGYWSYKLGI